MILWVDDNDDLRHAVAEHLGAIGYDVVEAASAELALEYLDDAPPDLLLTDFRLPGANGLQLARAARDRVARPGAPPVPVLLVTSHAEQEDLRQWQDDDAFRLLEKPFELAQLEATIASLLAGEAAASPTAARVSGSASVPAGEPIRAVPPRRHRNGPPWLRLALAAGLAAATLVVALPYLGPAPPDLPQPTTASETRRSGVVQTIEPFGPIAGLPERFAWHAATGAARYTLEVTGVDGSVLWRGESEQTELAAPAELAGRLLPLAAYYWRVQALDASGDPLAASEPVRFRIVEPAPATP